MNSFNPPDRSFGSSERVHHESSFVAVGQLTVDTTVVLDDALPVGDRVGGTMIQTFGGSAAIAAHNAAVAVGGDVWFAGHVGHDPAGIEADTALRLAGVQIGAVVPTESSPEVLVLVEPGGERTMVSSPGAPRWEELNLSTGPKDLVLFEGWHLFEEGPFDDLVVGAKERGSFVAIDVCSASSAKDPIAHAARLESLGPDLLIANEAEAEALGLGSREGGANLAIHSGPSPTKVRWEGGWMEFPVQPRLALDTTGAGDTFAGALLCSLSIGHDLPTSVRMSHAAASEVVMTVGSMLKPGFDREGLVSK